MNSLKALGKTLSSTFRAYQLKGARRASCRRRMCSSSSSSSSPGFFDPNPQMRSTSFGETFQRKFLSWDSQIIVETVSLGAGMAIGVHHRRRKLSSSTRECAMPRSVRRVLSSVITPVSKDSELAAEALFAELPFCSEKTDEVDASAVQNTRPNQNPNPNNPEVPRSPSHPYFRNLFSSQNSKEVFPAISLPFKSNDSLQSLNLVNKNTNDEDRLVFPPHSTPLFPEIFGLDLSSLSEVEEEEEVECKGTNSGPASLSLDSSPSSTPRDSVHEDDSFSALETGFLRVTNQAEAQLSNALGVALHAEDPALASAMFSHASSRGLAAASFNLALACHREAEKTSSEALWDQAVRHYQDAVSKGHLQAMHNLAALAVAQTISLSCQARHGVDARALLERASEGGLAQASYTLALAHYHASPDLGITSPSLSRALTCLRCAAAQGMDVSEMILAVEEELHAQALREHKAKVASLRGLVLSPLPAPSTRRRPSLSSPSSSLSLTDLPWAGTLKRVSKSFSGGLSDLSSPSPSMDTTPSFSSPSSPRLMSHHGAFAPLSLSVHS